MELIKLLRELELMVEEAPLKKLSHNKILLDRDEALDIIEEIKTIIPEEVKQASWINTERTRILGEAQKEAEEIILRAQKEAENMLKEREAYIKELDLDYQNKLQEMIESSEVVKQSKIRAEEIRQKSENYKLEMIESSHLYADDVLSMLEEKIEQMLQQVKNNKQELNRK